MASSIRAPMGIVSLVLIAGSLCLLLLVVLSGVKNHSPLNKIFFLQADTSSIAGAGRPLSQWTYFYVCGANNTDCGKAVPDLPFGYAWIGGSTGAPAPLTGSFGKGTTSKYYYYMWRFGWVFFLLALVFDAFAFITAFLSPCSRLASGLAAFMLMPALFFMSLAAALMTTTFVKARNVFRSSGMPAQIGKYAFGFTWGAWAAMFLAACMLFLGCGLGGRRDDTATGGTGRRGFYRRQRTAKSGTTRGSFVDNESQRRVKDEYA